MPELAEWLELYASDNPSVKLRAARALLRRSGEAPLAVLLDILDTLSHQRLGAIVLRALQDRRDPELPGEMIERLGSADDFIREAACGVLGRSGDPAATPHLLAMLEDPHGRVRRAAVIALGDLKDPTAIPVLEQQLERYRNESIDTVFVLESALRSLGAPQDSDGASKDASSKTSGET